MNVKDAYDVVLDSLAARKAKLRDDYNAAVDVIDAEVKRMQDTVYPALAGVLNEDADVVQAQIAAFFSTFHDTPITVPPTDDAPAPVEYPASGATNLLSGA